MSTVPKALIKMLACLMKAPFRLALMTCFVLGACAGLGGHVLAAVPTVQLATGPLTQDLHGNAGMVLSSDRVLESGTYLYQAGFNVKNWSGRLTKRAVTMSRDSRVEIAGQPEWEAGSILSGDKDTPPLPLPDDRRIYTFASDAASGVRDFKWDMLTPQQKSMLDTAGADGPGDGLGARRVAFLRGARSDEIGQRDGIFRQRDNVLGDIVNSNLVHVGAPMASEGGAAYGQYYEKYRNRTAALYVGANDGMLHAFDAASGRELFAYVPQALLRHLAHLTRPDYTHRPYVDGAIAVAEAQVQGKWRTVLAAGMGGGAQGVFALDITDPASIASGMGALWEFTDIDDPDIGNVLNAPVIAKMKTRVVSGIPEYHHFVMVGSGINNNLKDGNDNPEAPAVLFLLALDKKAGDPWLLGVNYFKFKKPILDTALPNGLSSPATVVNGDGSVRYVYAGDLQGNLWKFDFAGGLPWSKENASTTPLFTAMDENLRRQPITTQPRVILAPGGGYVILFGTGKLMEEEDLNPSNYSTQSYFGIFDSLQKSYKISGRHQLEARSVVMTGSALQITGKAFAFGESAGTKRGWYLDFAAARKTGERSVSNALIDSGRLIFNTLIPCSAPCSKEGGYRYLLDPLSGLPFGKDAGGMQSQAAMNAPPVLIHATTVRGERDIFGKAIVRRKSVLIGSSSAGTHSTSEVRQSEVGGSVAEVNLPAMRLSWRELLNWQELRQAAGKK